MAEKTFTSAPLSSSDVNTYLMKQAVVTCTSGARPSSPPTGHVIYETDTGLLRVYNGTAWQCLFESVSYTNTVAIGTPTSGVNTAITSWPTLQYNDGDIAYAAGIFTVATPGKYRWDLSVTWPAATAAFRQFHGVLVNGSAVVRGQQANQTDNPQGSMTVTTSYVEKLAAGGTIQGFVNVSTSGASGIIPAAFALTRVG